MPASAASAVPAAASVGAPPSDQAVGTSAGFRFGIGFALGALVIVALAWLAINSVHIADGDIAFDIAFGSPTVATFSGSGSAMSEPVHLGGVVDVDWTARPSSPAACRIRALLRSASRPNDQEVIVERETITEATGTHVLYGLIDNDYVIDVASNCDWTLRLKPRP